MNQPDIFSFEEDTIDIDGMDAMVQFSQYDPTDEESFMEGLELSEDLTNRFGTILYSSGTKLTPVRLSRLIELRVANPTMDFYFRINRSAALIQSFRKEIKQQIVTLFNRHERTNVYHEFMSHVGENIDNFVSEVLGEENITLLLYQMRFIGRTSKKTKSQLFQEHSLNVALITLAIASSKLYGKVIGKSKTKLMDVFKVALFHNYGAIKIIDKIIDAPEEKRLAMYWEANHEGYLSMDDIKLHFTIKDALNLIYDHNMGQRDIVDKYDWPSIMANIVIVAELFLQYESGLFTDPYPVRKVVDLLNVRVAEKDLNEIPVRALTLGLNLQDIFDFYKEMNDLIKQCPYNSAVAYPLVGFKSPTIFICKNEVLKCEYIETSLKAVNLLRDMGELKKGKYRRCWLLTPKLIHFYKTHYKAIKGTVANSNSSNSH